MSPHIHHIPDPAHSGSRKMGWTLLLNVGITATEFIGGILSGSLALLSDAGHNLSDVIALILAYFGARGAAIKPTKRSTYGFKRLEVVTAFVNALTLVVIAVIIIIEAFDRYSDPPEVNAPIMLSIAIIGLIGNVLSVWILKSNRNDTINMRAAFLHMLYDAISSVAVIIGGIVIIFTGWLMLDLILSVLIAMMILWSSLDVLKEATGIFMESAPRGIDIDRVTDTIEKTHGVRQAHHFHIWSISSTEVALSCHIEISRDDQCGCADVIHRIHQRLKHEHGIGHITIQPEFDICPDPPLQKTIDPGKNDKT